MKSTPLLVSTPLIQPILDEIKTQTRRIILPQPQNGLPIKVSCREWETSEGQFECPYGTIGDQLWVREEHYQYGHWTALAGQKTPTGRQKWKFVQDTDDTLYYPPPTFRRSMPRVHPEISAWYKRLGRFMPKKCSRITLEITDIRVERVQDISEADALDDGGWKYSKCPIHKSPVASFHALWDCINAARGFTWESNPYVWALTFKKL